MALSPEQIERLNAIKTPWGEIGYITYKRTYARRIKEDKPNSQTEEYIDTVLRVVKAAQKQLKCGFTNEEEYRLAEILLNLKGSVAGRFLWQLGTKTVDNLGLPSLQNCAVTVVNEPIRPFTWAMELLMLGCGVGYNIQKEYVYQIPPLQKQKINIVRCDDKSADFIVPDTREGWVKLLGKVLKSHFYTGKGFTYSCQLIRSEGELIKSFGGTASGPQILSDGIDKINNLLNTRSGKKLRPIDCLDIMNLIASIVVAGNVRRCLPENYQIQMADNTWKFIQDINVGDKILFENKEYPVLSKFVQGEQPLVKINTVNGFHICTRNHRWLVKNVKTGDVEWRHAFELENTNAFKILIKK